MSFVNFDDRKPVYVKLELISSMLMSPNYTHVSQVKLERHEIELHDSWVWPEWITYDGDYWKFSRFIFQKYHIGMYDKKELNYYRA